jgi:hypothetical protein
MASLEKLASLDIDLFVMAHSYMLTGEDARGYIGKSIEATKRFKKRIEDLLAILGGDPEGVVKKIFQEDYLEAQAILQDERSYLINLQAKVKAVAERK